MSVADEMNSNAQKGGNPYLAELNRRVDEIMGKDVDAIRSKDLGMKHINADNDWILPKLAGMALLLGYAWNSPQAAAFKRKEVWAQLEKLINRLLGSCHNGKWWRELPGTGDHNINRFTLVAVTDLYLRIGPYLGEELKKKYLKVIEQAAEVQVGEHDQDSNRSRGKYPNMDAYFMLIMEECSRILNRSEHHVRAMNFLGYLEDCLFDGGGFVYFMGTNECEVYHQLAVMTLVRLWEVTRSRRVLDLLQKTLPYYPNAVEPSGVVEYYTDPFWKHYWSEGTPYALDALATLFPEAPEAGEHRYLANALRKEKEETNEMFLVWAMDLWRPEKGVKPRENWIRYDASLQGPRGRSGAFSWAGTAGVCQDTFVGAMVAHSPDKYSALQAAGIDILLEEPPIKQPESAWFGRRLGTSAYVSGYDYLRRMVVTEKMACMAICSPVYGGGIGWNHFLPESGWHMRQVWYFDPQRIIGMMVVEAVYEDCSPARSVNIYARLGGSESKVEEQQGVFIRGDLRLRVVATNLPSRVLKPAYRFCTDNDFKSTELILSENITGKPSKSFMALMEIYPSSAKQADIAPVAPGQLCGFKASADKMDVIVAFNAGNAAVDLKGLKSHAGSTCYLTASSQPCVRSCDNGFPGTIGQGELIVASAG
jgi:hypothetical protein